MFENYKNINASYIPDNAHTQQINTRLPKKPLAVYDLSGNIIGFSWEYGDGVRLKFTTTGTVTDDTDSSQQTASTYLTGKYMRLDIYNFRYDIVYTETISASTEAIFDIDSEASEQLERNNYTCTLTLLDSDNTTPITTLFGNSGAKFFVK